MFQVLLYGSVHWDPGSEAREVADLIQISSLALSVLSERRPCMASRHECDDDGHGDACGSRIEVHVSLSSSYHHAYHQRLQQARIA